MHTHTKEDFKALGWSDDLAEFMAKAVEESEEGVDMLGYEPGQEQEESLESVGSNELVMTSHPNSASSFLTISEPYPSR